MTQPPNQSIPAQPPRGGENTRFDPSLGELVGIMWQRRGVTLISFAVVLTLAAIVMGQWQPRYRAVAEVGITRHVQGGQTADEGALQGRAVLVSAQEIETLIAEMKSQDVLSAAVAVLRGDGVWAGQDDKTSSAATAFWDGIFGGDNAEAMSAVPTSATPVSEAQLIDRLRAGLEAKRIGNAAVIEVTYQSASAGLSATVLQAVLESHVWWREGRQKQYLRRQLQEETTQYHAAQGDLAKHEESLMRWQRDASMFDPEEAKLMLARIYALDEQAEQVGRELATARIALGERQDGQKLSDLLAMSDVARNPIVSQLAARFDGLRSEYVTLDQRYGPKHPVMQSKTRELDDLRAELLSAAQRAAERANRDLERVVLETAESLKLLRQQRGEWQNRMAARHDRIQGQAGLLRAVEAARAQVLELGRQTQTLQRDLMAFRGDVEILRPAVAPATAAFPARRDLWLMAVLAAVFGAVVAAMLRHYFDQTIDDDFQPETGLGIRLYARIPDMTAPNMPAVGANAGREAVGHLAVLMRIIRQGKPQPADGVDQAQVIAMASAVSGEGKSHLAWALAGVLAGFGARVLVLNADLHDPDPDTDPTVTGDITAVLSGTCLIEDAMGRDALRGFDHLGAKFPVPGNLATGLIESGLGDLMAALRPNYDHIIVDTPPILSVADAMIVMRHADVRLFAVRFGHSKRRDMGHAMDQLRAVGIVPDGVIMNGARPRPAYGVAPPTSAPTEQMS
ncbi:GumC family protein [Thalassospira lucentensis]|uniref:GumC family protein n=1 Tax=Thalassospira lucentensis TaxID=168935 RepID=UPI003AA9B470